MTAPGDVVNRALGPADAPAFRALRLRALTEHPQDLRADDA
jgi:hypothetical protein